jgi:hypothetical protein
MFILKSKGPHVSFSSSPPALLYLISITLFKWILIHLNSLATGVNYYTHVALHSRSLAWDSERAGLASSSPAHIGSAGLSSTYKYK